MAMNIERLLRLTADYHTFCDETYAKDSVNTDPDEMDISELELIAAAGDVGPSAYTHSDGTN